jgi:putative ABC transport system ATP-binding protein
VTVPAALKLDQVRKDRPGPGGSAVTILGGIDLELRTGEILVIVGPSGGGKSTLVRLLNRLEDPDGGSIRFQDQDVRTLDPIELRRRIALVPQKPFMFPGTVRDNLQRPEHYRGAPVEAVADSFRPLLERVGLTGELLDRDARTLSLGQQQRVGLARALTLAPEILVLDEPTSALDRPGSDRLAQTLRALCRQGELTLLLVTHDLRFAAKVADRVAYLEGGRIHELAGVAEFFSRPASVELRRFLAEPAEPGASP